MLPVAALPVGGVCTRAPEALHPTCNGGYFECKKYRYSPGLNPCELKPARPRHARTHVSIRGEEWHINGQPTSKGKTWKGASIQGTLFNARMVNAM